MLSRATWAAAILVISTMSWAAIVLSAPYLVSRPAASPRFVRTAGAVYLLGSIICHQRAERSFHPWGVQVPVCARCEGIYLAAPFGASFALARRRRTRVRPSRADWQRAIVLAGIPTLATLVWEWMGGGMPPGIVRALAGGLIGAVIAAAISVVAVGELR